MSESENSAHQNARRKFIKRGPVFLLAPFMITAAGSAFFSMARHQPVRLVSGSDDKSGQHRLSVVDGKNNDLITLPITQRVHDQALNPVNHNQVVFFARRPGNEAYVVDISTQHLQHTFKSQAGRHFFGHGFFTPDANYLVSCENAYEKGHGVIVVRDAKTWQVLTEFPANGVGTHQIKLMPDAKTLVVANGGIRTHPDTPRKKLNLPTMKPNLSYIDLNTGKVLASYEPIHHQMSIRHIDINQQGKVAIAMQHQGSLLDEVPLIAFHHGEEQLQYAKDENTLWQRMKHYVGSIAFNAAGDIAAATSPRGNLIVFWDATQQSHISKQKIPDVSGVAYTREDKAFIASNGKGNIYFINPDKEKKQIIRQLTFKNTRWDNHLNIA